MQDQIPPLHISIWALRHLMETQPFEVLDFLADHNASGIELAGCYRWTPDQMARELSDRRINVIGLHGPVVDHETSSDEIVEWAKERMDLFSTSNFYLEISPQTFSNPRNGLSNYVRSCEIVSEIASALSSESRCIALHCYNHDFNAYDNRLGIDIIANLDPENLIGLQIDTYWAIQAGFPPKNLKNYNVVSTHLNSNGIFGKPFQNLHDEELFLDYARELKAFDNLTWVWEDDNVNSKSLHEIGTLKELSQALNDWGRFWSSL